MGKGRQALPLLILLAVSAVASGSELSDLAGRQAVIEGKISVIPWQHLIRSPQEGKHPVYVDVTGTSAQVVVYARGTVDCPARVLFEGTVLAARGESKRPGSSGTTYTEYQLEVESWRCTDPARVEKLLDLLAGSDRSPDDKRNIEQQIILLGRQAVEPLIAHLPDQRLFATEQRIANENLMINAPANRKPVDPVYREERILLGDRCSSMLARIFTPPDYHSPHESRGKPYSLGPDGWYFRIKNWNDWWARNRYRPLDEIRAGMKPVIDAYWISHGAEQPVE